MQNSGMGQVETENKNSCVFYMETASGGAAWARPTWTQAQAQYYHKK